jgi:hypothetical protein
MDKRVLLDASFAEIIARKKRIGGVDLRAALYLHDAKTLIVTSISGILETGEPMVLPLEAANTLVGQTICDHLLLFQPKTPNVKDYKKTDWVAFRASGARSVSSFESHSWIVHLSTVGDSSISMKAAPYKSLHHEIAVEGVARPRHEEVGAVLRRTLDAASAIRAAGLI